ncbi:neuraminidase [Morchella conica CCBAS932]|uniref:Neuraminidase n=1 Tax=Morchella conica CCBAS932 TaxID=1392247 RepID=A0A3N4L2T4_9PEZI|nr:neuraminidase [Morchella conica CCBAS932]
MTTIKSFFTLLLLPLLLFTTLTHAVSPSLDGAAVSMGSGTYPRATRLSDNSLLGVTTTFSSGTNIITIVRSTDDGLSWTPHGEVTRGVGDIDNGFLLQLPDGRILCAFRNHSKDGDAYTIYRITVCVSSDNGATWTYLSTPETGSPPNGLWEPFMRIGNDGRIQLYYSRELAADDQDNLVRFSSDGGANWSASSVISGSGITSRDGMVGVAKYNDGADRLIAVFETNEGGVAGSFRIKSVASSDDGATWGNRQTVFEASGTNNNAGAPQVASVGGSLVVSFMTDEDTGLHQWVSGASAKIVASTAISSGSVTWGNKLTVGGVQSNWPGMLTIDDRHVMVMYDNGGAKSQRVLLQ